MELTSDQQAWLVAQGHLEAPVRLAGGASPRTFWRLPDTGRLLMVTPTASPTEHGASASPTWPRMQRYLAGLGLPVPALHALSDDGRLALVDDLGDTRLYEQLRADPAHRVSAYEAALDLLVRFQRVTTAPPPFEVPVFTADHLRAELAEFADMALEARLQITLSPGERGVLAEVTEDLAAQLLPERLAHRDFQSQNLMVTDRGLVLIDFQDAFLAPATYDLVALLRDSYIVLNPAELDHVIGHFARATDQSQAALTDAFHLQTIQRKLKDSGRFETLARKGKPHFLAFFADSIAYVVHALRASGRYPALLELLHTRLPEARAALS